MEEQNIVQGVEENPAGTNETEQNAEPAVEEENNAGTSRREDFDDTFPRDAILLILEGDRFVKRCHRSRGWHRRGHCGGRMPLETSSTSDTSSSDSSSRSRSRGRRSRSRSRGGRSRSRSRGKRSRSRSRERSRSRSRGRKCKSHHKKKLNFKCKGKWGKFKPKFKGHHGRKFMVWL